MKLTMSVVPVLLGIIMLTSCDKSKKEKFSCDPKLDAWAHHNLARIDSSFHRVDLIAYPSGDTQRAVYQSLSTELKCRIWKEKLAAVVNEYGLSRDENDSIGFLALTLSPGIYASQDSLDYAAKRLGGWLDRNSKRFYWDSTAAFFIAQTYFTKRETQSILDKLYAGDSTYFNRPIGAGAKPCICYYDIACSLAGQGSCDENCGCDIKGGCGVFGTTDCDGRCNGIMGASGGVDPKAIKTYPGF